MIDVDGVLVSGRPGDGRHWDTFLEADLGLASESLQEHFFRPYWDDIVTGRAGLMEGLTTALQVIAPHISPDTFVSYWFAKDSRVVDSVLEDLEVLRAAGIGVYLATNQEHVRAAYLMNDLGLGAYVDGIYYSAQLGAKKPDEQFFLRIPPLVGLPAGDLLLIDDSRRNVDAAIMAGWQARHWTTDSPRQLLHAAGIS
jgi:putative hydrolase of the HAD superfamily